MLSVTILPPFVEALRHLLKVDDGPDILPELLDQPDVDVGLEQGRADLLQQGVEDLKRKSIVTMTQFP